MIFVHLYKHEPKVRYLRAGHELLIHKRNGTFQEEEWRGGFPIGLFPKRDKDEWVELELQSGDELYLYTDGITDGLPEKEPRIRPLLSEASDISEKLENQTFFHYLSSRYGWQNMDDATLLTLRWAG